jgi:hypothetical protein
MRIKEKHIRVKGDVISAGMDYYKFISDMNI